MTLHTHLPLKGDIDEKTCLFRNAYMEILGYFASRNVLVNVKRRCVYLKKKFFSESNVLKMAHKL